jgi:L-alanine-DL-glutamate epimerase-like enolase superfamily enzyme
MRNGCIEVPTWPGLGIEVDEARARLFAVAD